MHLMPNAISALRIALTPIVIICLLQEVEWLDGMALVLFVIGAATDFADGVLARLMQAQSRLGRFLDPLADKVLVLGTFGVLTWLHPQLVPWWAVVLIALRDAGVTWLRTRAESQGRSVNTWRFAKYKTALQLFFLAVFLSLRFLQHGEGSVGRWSEQIMEGPYMFWFLMVVVAVTLLTGLGYILRTDYIEE